VTGWHRSKDALPFPSDHVYAETTLERQITEKAATIGSRHQFIQQVMVTPTSGYERPGYRLVELRVIAYTETLRDARRIADDEAGASW
jgi:hypothetical protein